MGGVKDRYMKYASAGDQYVGRCTNCADHNSAEFSLSTPKLYFYSFEMAYCIACKKELDDFLSDRLYQLTDDADDGHIKYLAKILFSYIFHHHEYLA